MVTIENAMIYSTAGEMAHEIQYSNGTRVRAVLSPAKIIRMEHLKAGEWKQSGKPYIVSSDKRRQAERMIETVKSFIQA